MKQHLKNLVTDDSGQDLIEYALIAAMIALGADAVMKGLNTDIGKVFNGLGNELTSAVS